jgi:hypothetical protein
MGEVGVGATRDPLHSPGESFMVRAPGTALMRQGSYNAPMSSAHERLVQFLDKKMQMSHIYQPVMLEVLLTRSGRAPIRTIATAILAHDESQIDYYTEIVKQMPGRVLGRHGIVKRQGHDYAIADDLRDLSEADRDAPMIRRSANGRLGVQAIDSAGCKRRRLTADLFPRSRRTPKELALNSHCNDFAVHVGRATTNVNGPIRPGRERPQKGRDMR